MALNSGTRLGAYEIVGLIGAGGMGEVYRARDTKLKRDVAIKVLPSEWVRDPERLSRCQREGEVLASLNHRHIAQIYGHEEADGAPCLIMEYVAGETLHERLQRGPIPVREALEIAQQIADAVDAAHERNIVHRDLKPANIKITPEGEVKVLDFGLARTAQFAPEENLSNSPTRGGTVTGQGVILGTSGYMSPEQAKGRTADARSDVWAFGVLLYEMLSGTTAFDGETVVEILGGVLRTDPDWTALPADTPPLIRSLLRRCLQKDRVRRLRSIADARFQIEEALQESGDLPAPPVTTDLARKRLWMIVALASTALAVGVLLWSFVIREPAAAEEVRLQIVTPEADDLFSFAVSPDARKIAFQGVLNGKNQLWLRSLDSDKSAPLMGTENASHPFWSPDSDSIAFFADGKLKRLNLSVGSPQVITETPEGPPSTWSSAGDILFTNSGTAPIYRVSATGGSPVAVTTLDPPRQVSHRIPQFLPDGRHFLYYVIGPSDTRGVYIGSLDDKTPKRLFGSDTAAAFLPPDQVLYVTQGTLFAQPFNTKTLEVTGSPTAIADGFKQSGVDWIAEPPFSVSRNGTIVYRDASGGSQLMWVDAQGRQINTLGEPDSSDSLGMRLSPDERQVAMDRSTNGILSLWILEIGRNVYRRFTANPVNDQNPVWSPDGSQMAFSSRLKLGNLNIYRKAVNGSGAQEPIVTSPENKFLLDWSPDGAFLLYTLEDAKTGRDLWAVSLKDMKPFPIVQTPATEENAFFSPDGRWIVFQSSETGKNDIYIQQFPGPAVKSAPISTSGGSAPRWKQDGKSIFYIGSDNRVMSVPVTLMPDGRVFPGSPVALFRLRPRSLYAPSRDGQRFLIKAPTEAAASAPMTIILNWTRK